MKVSFFQYLCVNVFSKAVVLNVGSMVAHQVVMHNFLRPTGVVDTEVKGRVFESRVYTKFGVGPGITF